MFGFDTDSFGLAPFCVWTTFGWGKLFMIGVFDLGEDSSRLETLVWLMELSGCELILGDGHYSVFGIFCSCFIIVISLSLCSQTYILIIIHIFRYFYKIVPGIFRLPYSSLSNCFSELFQHAYSLSYLQCTGPLRPSTSCTWGGSLVRL